MIDHINPRRIADHAQERLRQRKVRLLLQTSIVIIIGVLLAFASIWQYRNTRPITPEQLATLSNLVAATSAHSSLSRQKIWSNLHKRFEVRRASQLKQSDFDAAMAYLASITAS